MFCNTVQFSASTSSLFKHSHTPCANKVFGGHSTFDELFSVKQNEKKNKLYPLFCMVMNTILKPEQNHCWTDIKVPVSGLTLICGIWLFFITLLSSTLALITISVK